MVIRAQPLPLRGTRAAPSAGASCGQEALTPIGTGVAGAADLRVRGRYRMDETSGSVRASA